MTIWYIQNNPFTHLKYTFMVLLISDCTCKAPALEELFGEEEQDMQQVAPQETQTCTEGFLLFPSHLTLFCGGGRRGTLCHFCKKYLCAQASSTPSERVFSTAGDTISAESSRILPEKADMLVFLHKNS